MHARKTGALIRASALAGAVMAGADMPHRRAVDGYGRESSASRSRSSTTCSTSRARAAELGKTAGKDAAAGKPTYPALFGLERRRPARRRSCGRRAPTQRCWTQRLGGRARRAGPSDRADWCPANGEQSRRRATARRAAPPRRTSTPTHDPRRRALRLDRCSSTAGSRRRANARARSSSPARSGSTASRQSRPARSSPPTARSTSTTPDHPYVGRGGLKLAHALDAFGLDVAGRPRSTSARRPAASPTSCCSAARRRWSRSTSATASSTGGCAPIPGSSSWRA